ncbi:MAG: hypothetical protein PHE43_03095 [Candidatus Nanoarchaeia archaeon]|nr:hypothetical protein [Candidatus Nanoarchaeia archaeon]
MFNKKGAVELSISTIVIVVLGVTLLILGLSLVRGIFSKVEGLTDQSFQAGEKLIQDQMSSNEKFYVSGVTFVIESGKSITVHTGIQNFGDPGKSNAFKLDVKVGDAGGSKSWFVLPPEQTIGVGSKKAFPFVINVPDGTEPGKSFTFTIEALKDGKAYDSQAIIVQVKED